MLPNAKQVQDYQDAGYRNLPTLFSHASPYSDRRFSEAAAELRPSDFIIMHCMGYTAEMKREVARVFGKPVLLSRQVVASSISQLV